MERQESPTDGTDKQGIIKQQQRQLNPTTGAAINTLPRSKGDNAQLLYLIDQWASQIDNQIGNVFYENNLTQHYSILLNPYVNAVNHLS